MHERKKKRKEREKGKWKKERKKKERHRPFGNPGGKDSGNDLFVPVSFPFPKINDHDDETCPNGYP